MTFSKHLESSPGAWVCTRLRNSLSVASLSAVEKSSESRTMPECEVRINVRAMLSAIASKAYLITSLKKDRI